MMKFDTDISHSLWQATAPKQEARASLSGTHECDVAIIGGGYTGLSAALHLAEQGIDTCVLEARHSGWGASGRAGGQVNPALPVATPDLLFKTMPQEFATRLAKASLGSADFLFALIKKHQIACDARQAGWIRAHHSHKARQNAIISAARWRDYGADFSLLDEARTKALTGSAVYHSSLLTRAGGLVHPLKLVQGLAHAAITYGAQIFENSPVTSLEPDGSGWQMHTTNGTLKSRFVIFATNAYSGAFGEDGRRYQNQLAKSIVRANPIQIATEPLPPELADSILPEGHSISDSRRMILYARREPDNRIVYGSIGQRTANGTLSGYEWLKRDAIRTFPQLEGVAWPYQWGGKIAITDTHLPHLIQLDHNIIAGLGYNGRGVAMANLMGKILADYAMGTPPSGLPLPLLPPKRFFLGRIKQTGLNSYISIAKGLDWLQRR